MNLIKHLGMNDGESIPFYNGISKTRNDLQ